MKTHRFMLTLLLLATTISISLAQNANGIGDNDFNSKYNYAYISISGKAFTKKMKVEVDLGDTPEQIKLANEYAEGLSNRMSYAAILNYMSDNGYEFIESRADIFSFQGTGGSNGIILIMRKKVG